MRCVEKVPDTKVLPTEEIFGGNSFEPRKNLMVTFTTEKGFDIIVIAAELVLNIKIKISHIFSIGI